MVKSSLSVLDADETSEKRLELNHHSSSRTSRSEALKKACRIFKSGTETEVDEVLILFIAHIVILDDLSVQDRARNLPSLNTELQKFLSDTFLPRIYLALAAAVPDCEVSIDVDGRIFAALLVSVSLKPPSSESFSAHFGVNATAEMESIITELTLDINFARFASRYPTVAPSSQSVTTTPQTLEFKLLPFSNDVFEDHLSSIHVAVEPESYQAPSDSNAVRLQFGKGILFADTQHWHNTKKAILPKHLGGAVEKIGMTAKQKFRALRADQRFMAQLQRHAATLTGAMGSSLQQIVIISVGSGHGNGKRGAIKVSPMIKWIKPFQVFSLTLVIVLGKTTGTYERQEGETESSFVCR